MRCLGLSTRGHLCIPIVRNNQSVHDQGIGIALEYQEKIFESFFQVEGGSTRRAGGTGLGLAITKKLTELHGGRIWVESELGKGSSFFVEIPWQTQTP